MNDPIVAMVSTPEGLAATLGGVAALGICVVLLAWLVIFLGSDDDDLRRG